MNINPLVPPCCIEAGYSLWLIEKLYFKKLIFIIIIFKLNELERVVFGTYILILVLFIRRYF